MLPGRNTTTAMARRAMDYLGRGSAQQAALPRTSIAGPEWQEGQLSSAGVNQLLR